MSRQSLITLPLLMLVCMLNMTVVHAQEASQQTHRVGAAKLIVDDLEAARGFFESLFDIEVIRHYEGDPASYSEYIMGFSQEGPKLALFSPSEKMEKPLPKPAAPQVLIYTPEFDAVVQRIEENGYPARHLETDQFRIVITRDPAGNAVEILAREGDYAVGGSKLIVDNRAAAEAFYQTVFNASSGTRYQTQTYDEVLMQFGGGPFLALFQPLDEEPLEKSRFPVSVIYTRDFDLVLEKIEEIGLGYRRLNPPTSDRGIIIAQDPAGNAIEIIEEMPE